MKDTKNLRYILIDADQIHQINDRRANLASSVREFKFERKTVHFDNDSGTIQNKKKSISHNYEFPELKITFLKVRIFPRIIF